MIDWAGERPAAAEAYPGETGAGCPASYGTVHPKPRGYPKAEHPPQQAWAPKPASAETGPKPAGSRPGALLQDLAVQETLRQIIRRCTDDPELLQDLMQECLLSLWKAEEEHPGHTRSWYLQHCRFQVQHWLEKGRSVDSFKRARGDRQIRLDGVNDDAVLGDYHTNGELFEGVSCRDLVITLARHLAPRERVVLKGLASGMILREVARHFAMSYPTALKYRRRIAALTLKLGVVSGMKRDQAR